MPVKEDIVAKFINSLDARLIKFQETQSQILEVLRFLAEEASGNEQAVPNKKQRLSIQEIMEPSKSKMESHSQ